VDQGSRGGNGDNGAAGGGVVRVQLEGSLIMAGGAKISCNGLPGTVVSPGGGSGGSVWISVDGSVEGSGSIRAHGGDGFIGGGGGGSGGRVAVHYGSTMAIPVYVEPGGQESAVMDQAGYGSFVSCNSYSQYYDPSLLNCRQCPSLKNAGGPSSWSGWLTCCGAGLYLADAQSLTCTR
jgi:hypothetical protein